MRTQRQGRLAVTIAACVALTLAAAGCGHSHATTATTSPSSTTTSTTEVVALVCRAAPPSLIAVLTAGLRTGAGRLSSVEVVRTDDLRHTYFIAGTVTAASSTLRALWVSTADDGSGALFSVNAAARTSSRWHVAASTRVHYTATDRGAVDAVGCH